MVAVVIEVIFVRFHHAPVLQAVQNAMIDWVVQVQRGVVPSGRPFLHTVWIDIDDETHARWNHPPFIPRDKLADLVRFALAGDPALVIVDVNLTLPRGRGNALIQLIRDHSSEVGQTDADPTPIIFARSLPHRWGEQAGPVRTLDPSFLDSTADSAVGIHWASFVYDRDRDWMVRRWRIWEPVCMGGAPRLIPSVPLLAAVLVNGGTGGAQRLAEVMRTEAGNVMPDPCASVGSNQDGTKGAPGRFSVGSLDLQLPPDEIGQRISYTMPWHLNDGESWPVVRACQKNVEILTRLQAHQVGEHMAQAGPPKAQILYDALVVIGGSFAEGHDLHPTPLGDMPGALVVANSVNSILAHGQIETPGRVGTLVIEIALVLFMAWMFAARASFWAVVFSTLALVVFMLPVSVFFFFQHGLWLDFALPLMAVFVHNLVKEFEEWKHGGRMD